MVHKDTSIRRGRLCSKAVLITVPITVPIATYICIYIYVYICVCSCDQGVIIRVCSTSVATFDITLYFAKIKTKENSHENIRRLPNI